MLINATPNPDEFEDSPEIKVSQKKVEKELQISADRQSVTSESSFVASGIFPKTTKHKIGGPKYDFDEDYKRLQARKTNPKIKHL